MRLFGLIGFPLSHSFSKRFFTEKFEREGLTDCRYELFPIESINELPDLIKVHPDLEGLNVTVPYKQAVFPYLDSSNQIPAELHACNCIKFSDHKLTGYNTDTFGFEKSLSPLLKPHHRHALILGKGGATAAVTFVLQQLGIGFTIVSRKPTEHSILSYQDIDKKIIENNPILINATPQGMYPQIDSFPDIPYSFISDRHLLYDLIYNPAETLFLKKGREMGATIKNGEEMLVLQAEESWRIWNGS